MPMYTSLGNFGANTTREVSYDSEINSHDYNITGMRAAANGKNPYILYDYGIFARNGWSGKVYWVYITSGPDVPGTQTTEKYNVNFGSYFPRLGPANGVQAYFEDTPTTMNLYLYTNGEITTQVDSALGGTSAVTYKGTTTNVTGRIAWNFNYYQVPTAPQNVTATNNQGDITVSWNAPSDDGGTPLTAYNIKRNDGTTFVVSGNTTSYTDGSPVLGTSYSYTVYARNKVTDYTGYETTSVGTSSGTVKAVNVPSVPANFSAKQSATISGRIDLSWSASALNGATASTLKYNIYQTTGTTSTLVATTTSTSYSFTGLNVWQSYTYSVSATSDAGTSATTPTSTVYAPGTPTAPTSVSAATSATVSGRITVSWVAPTNTAGGVTSYTLVADGTAINGIPSANRSWTIDNYTPGTSHNFWMVAHNAWGDSNGQQSAGSNTATTTAVGYPSAPLNLAGTSTTTVGAVHLTWAVPANTGGGLTFYNVYVDNSLYMSVSGTATAVDVTNLSQSTSHSLTLRARNSWTDATASNGPGPSSNSVSVVPGSAPSSPKTLTAVASTTQGGVITLSWAAPDYSGTSALTRYSVYSSDGTFIADVGPTTLTYNVSGLQSGIEYSFYVRAWNATSDSSNSPSLPSNTVTSTAQGAAGRPTGLTVSSSTLVASRLTLTWTAPSGTIVGYTVYRDGVAVQYLNATRFTDDNLDPNRAYSYYVTAANVYTPDGLPSTTVSATPGNSSSQVVNSLTVTDTTAAAISGTYALTAATGTTVQYARTTTNVASASVGTGTVIDTTNVSLNGRYGITSVPALNQLSVANGMAAFDASAVPSGTVTNETNKRIAGTNLTVTSADNVLQRVSYRANANPNSAGADVSAVGREDNAALGTVIDRSNEIFNGTRMITSVPNADEFTYPLTGLPVDADSTGSVVNNTNSDYNGTFTVSGTPSATQFQYKKTVSSTNSADIGDPYGGAARTDTPAIIEIMYRSGWLG